MERELRCTQILGDLGARIYLRGTFLVPMFQKTVKQMVEKTYLQVLRPPVPEEFLDQNVLFFLRNTKGMFPAGVCVNVGVHARACACV